MVIWSILTEEAWDHLQRKGRLRVARRHVIQEFLGSYVWMAAQMERRLTVPRPNKDAMPIWAWYQWEGAVRLKPDLRAGGHLPEGTKGVRVECRVDDCRVLLSDFDLWHYVLNYWYLPETEEHGEAFEKNLTSAGLSFYKCDHSPRCPTPNSDERSKGVGSESSTWTGPTRATVIADPRKQKSIQATLWELVLDDVVRVKEFTAR